jgi:hypothetical protein
MFCEILLLCPSFDCRSAVLADQNTGCDVLGNLARCGSVAAECENCDDDRCHKKDHHEDNKQNPYLPFLLLPIMGDFWFLRHTLESFIGRKRKVTSWGLSSSGQVYVRYLGKRKPPLLPVIFAS